MSEIKKLIKKNLIVNGQHISILVDGNDTLAHVIRSQLGLTGTKVGCRQGQCGICNVILNGKVTPSCIMRGLREKPPLSVLRSTTYFIA